MMQQHRRKQKLDEEVPEMNDIKVIEVALAGEKIGKLALTPDNFCAFEYDANYLVAGM